MRRRFLTILTCCVALLIACGGHTQQIIISEYVVVGPTALNIEIAGKEGQGFSMLRVSVSLKTDGSAIEAMEASFDGNVVTIPENEFSDLVQPNLYSMVVLSNSHDPRTLYISIRSFPDDDVDSKYDKVTRFEVREGEYVGKDDQLIEMTD